MHTKATQRAVPDPVSLKEGQVIAVLWRNQARHINVRVLVATIGHPARESAWATHSFTIFATRYGPSAERRCSSRRSRRPWGLVSDCWVPRLPSSTAYLLKPIDLPDPHALYAVSWDTEPRGASGSAARITRRCNARHSTSPSWRPRRTSRSWRNWSRRAACS